MLSLPELLVSTYTWNWPDHRHELWYEYIMEKEAKPAAHYNEDADYFSPICL